MNHEAIKEHEKAFRTSLETRKEVTKDEVEESKREKDFNRLLTKDEAKQEEEALKVKRRKKYDSRVK